jgi:SAM-dependent methyltransferase
MNAEEDTTFARALSQSVPSFYWFRDWHVVVDGVIRVHGVVASNVRVDVGQLRAYVNGIPADLSITHSISNGDDRFWFLPATHHGRVLIEAPALVGASSATVTLQPLEVERSHSYRHTFHLYFDHLNIANTPPVENIERVSGKGATSYNYFNNGATDFYRFLALAAQHGVNALNPEIRILDWGSGCARLTRHLLSLPQARGRVIGADIDPDNIAWSKTFIEGDSFVHVPLMPPTEFDDCSFDLVLANSVLSHLTSAAMHAWLSEVRRILRPGGVALLSYHGDFSLAGFCTRSPNFVENVWKSGFNDELKAAELDAVIGDATYYRQTFMTDMAALDLFGQYFHVEDFVVGMVSRYQNVAILRRVL